MLDMLDMLDTRQRIDAIVFDAEGVVVDTEPVWDATQMEFLRRRGLDFDRAALKPLMAGRTGLQSMEVLKEHLGLPDRVEDMLAERNALFTDILGDTVRFIDGFEEFHARVVEAGLAVAMATSMHREALQRMDRTLNVVNMFAGRIVTGDDVARSKPDPEIFLKAASLAETTATHCLALEDTPLGLQAANAAGMHTIGLCTTFGPAELSGLAHIVADGYAEAALELFRDTPPRM